MSYLDDLLGKQIKISGVILPQRKTLNVIGTAAVSAADNPATGETDLTINASVPGPLSITTAMLQDYSVTKIKMNNNAVDGDKILLDNNTYLRAKDLGGNEQNLLRMSSDDLLHFARAFKADSTHTLIANGAALLTTFSTVLSGAGVTATLANGAEGQFKFFLNIAAGAATVAPATTNGANQIVLGPQGVALLYFLENEWRVIPGVGANLSDDIQSFAAAGTWDGASKCVLCTGTTYTITTPVGQRGQLVTVNNGASGNVTFGGQIMAAGTNYIYTYLNASWRRVAVA